MKRTFRHGLMLTAALALASAPSAWAACTLDSQPVFHGLGGFVTACPDANPVPGYIYALATPATVNSAAQDFVCEEGFIDNGILVPCQPEAGTPGDGNVTVYYEFGSGNPGSVGCPNPAGAVTGSNPVAVQLVCNNGAGVLQTVGFSEDFSQYVIELSAPADGTPIAAGFDNGPSLTSIAGTTVCVNVPQPRVWSDCDPGATGETYSCPDPGVRPAASRGKLYTRTAACGTSPDPRISTWVPLPVLPDAAGDACNNVPAATNAGECAFVGTTATFGTTETAAVVGWFQVSGPGAANDKVKIDNAAFAQGKLIVAFSTTNETSIVGFNVYSGATKLNGNLITAKGAGSNAYNFEVGRGAVKGGKSVLVEAVKSDGTVEKTAPVSLK